MSSGSSSSGSAAAKQLMRGLFLRPTSFQISNVAQSLAVLQHFHRLAQRADAAAAAAAREAGDGARRLEHGGLYSVFVPRVSRQRQEWLALVDPRESQVRRGRRAASPPCSALGLAPASFTAL